MFRKQDNGKAVRAIIYKCNLTSLKEAVQGYKKASMRFV